MRSPDYSLHVLLIASLSFAHCSALVRPRPTAEEGDVIASKPLLDRKSRLRSWLDKPATKGALLVIAGGTSGAIAKTVTAPLERAKLVSQAGVTSNFLRIMKNVVKVEGWQGLWRGNMANVIRVVPNKGVLLMCSDMYKESVLRALPEVGGAAISSIAGGLAGLTAVLLTYPLELVRTRMAYRICDAASCEAYASVWGTLRAVFASGGPIGLYAGVGMTLVGTLPFEGIKFGAYDGKRCSGQNCGCGCGYCYASPSSRVRACGA